MSMREYPDSGYIVPLETIRKHLCERENVSVQAELDKLLDVCEFDPESISDFLDENLPSSFPHCGVFRPSDTDTVDDELMEQGEWYVVFHEDDLYERKLSEAGEALKQVGIEPTLSHWSIWG